MNRCRIIMAIVLWCIVWSIAPALAQEKKPSSVKLLQSLPGFKEPIDSVRFSPSGREVLFSGIRGTVLRDLESGEIVTQHQSGGVAIFSRDGKHIFIGSRYIRKGSKPLTRLDSPTWKATELMPHPGLIECMAASDDGKYLLCGGVKGYTTDLAGTISLWSIKENKLIRTLDGHLMLVKCLAFLPRTFQAMSTSSDGTTRRWNLADGKELNRIGKPSSENDEQRRMNFAVFKDGISYATGHYVHGVTKLEITHKMEFPPRSAWATDRFCLAISPDQKIIAVGYRDGLVRLYNSKTGKLIDSFPSNTVGASVNSIDFSPDRRFLATAGDGSNIAGSKADFTVKIWKVPSVE